MLNDKVTDFVAMDLELSARYNNIVHGVKTGSVISVNESRKLCLIAVMEAPVSHNAATDFPPMVTFRQPLTSQIGSILPSVVFSRTSIDSTVAVSKGVSSFPLYCYWEKNVELEVCAVADSGSDFATAADSAGGRVL
jgi:hypothetical protein